MKQIKPQFSGTPKSALLQAAVTLMRDQKPERLTLHDVAMLAGMPAEQAVAIFGSEKNLFLALGEEAVVRLNYSCTRHAVAAPPGDCAKQIEAIAQGYLDWAIQEPVAFRVLNDNRIVDMDESEMVQRQVAGLRSLLTRLIRRGKRAGQIPADLDEDIALLSLRAFVHGLAALVVQNQCDEWVDHHDHAALCETALHDFFRRLFSPPKGMARLQ